jgi:hypothetical protein
MNSPQAIYPVNTSWGYLARGVSWRAPLGWLDSPWEPAHRATVRGRPATAVCPGRAVRPSLPHPRHDSYRSLGDAAGAPLDPEQQVFGTPQRSP